MIRSMSCRRLRLGGGLGARRIRTVAVPRSTREMVSFSNEDMNGLDRLGEAIRRRVRRIGCCEWPRRYVSGGPPTRWIVGARVSQDGARHARGTLTRN
jgi:hypothetical protein